MKKRFYLIILLLLLLSSLILLSGCGVDKVTVDNPLSEKQIISYIQKTIYNDIGDDVIVEIISKDDLQTCTDWFDGCINYQPVEGGSSYKVRITSKDNIEIIGTGTYYDGYIEYDERYSNGKKIVNSNFTNNYKEQKGLYLINNEFNNLLKQNFDRYYIYKDVSNETGFDIFINSSNYNIINILIEQLHSIEEKYKHYTSSTYSIYIYKDESVFDSTNFDLYKNGKEDFVGQSYGKDMIEQYTGKEVIRIGSSKDFNYELFTSNGTSDADTNEEYIDYNTFDYLVFWYGYGGMQIFGVK